MKVYVVFDFPNIKDVDGEEADDIIECLQLDLEGFASDYGYDWYIDDAEEDVKNG